MHLLPGHPKCGVPHGHTYRVDVEVEGEVRNGMVIDFDLLKSALREVIRPFDHTNLNNLLAFPSCENLCLEIHKRLRPKVNLKLRVRVWEGEGKFAEYES